MKAIINYIPVFILLLSGCERFEVKEHTFDNSVYLDVSAIDQVQPTTFSNNIPTLTKDVVVTLSYPADEDVKATVSVDESLLSQYNEKYGTSLPLIPSKYLGFQKQEVIIMALTTIILLRNMWIWPLRCICLTCSSMPSG